MKKNKKKQQKRNQVICISVSEGHFGSSNSPEDVSGDILVAPGDHLGLHQGILVAPGDHLGFHEGSRGPPF